MVDYGKKITLKLFACNSGNGLNSIASQINKAFTNVTVVAPTNYWQIHYTDYLFYKKLHYGTVIFPGKWKNFNQ